MQISLNKQSFTLLIYRELRVIVLVIAIAFFVIYQIRGQITDVNDNIYTANELSTLREFYKDTYENMYKQLGNITDAKRIITSALPPTEDLREFLGVLNTFGAKHSVDIQTNIGETKLDSITYEDIPLRTVGITINLRGSIKNVRDYIADIEKLSYFFTIISIDERSSDATATQRSTTVQGKLWTKPEQMLTRTQTQ